MPLLHPKAWILLTKNSSQFIETWVSLGNRDFFFFIQRQGHAGLKLLTEGDLELLTHLLLSTWCWNYWHASLLVGNITFQMATKP